MPRFFHLTKKAKRRSLQPRARHYRLSPRFFHATFGIILLVSIVSYLVQVNSIATKGYKIKEYEQKVAELQQISRELETRSLELQSIKNVSEKVGGLNMEVARNVEYIEEAEKVAAR